MDDLRVRLAAFQWLDGLHAVHGELLRAATLLEGFHLDGQRVTLMGASGIWKPKVLDSLPLSITTTFDNPYQDRFGVDDVFVYSYRAGDSHQNEYLRRAARGRVPLIYFHAVSKALYQALYPVYILHNDEQAREIQVQLGDRLKLHAYPQNQPSSVRGVVAEGPADPVRSYLTVQAKVRLHQRVFRENVLTAYSRQCACCGFRHDELLDAAHIIEDNHEAGKPVVPNGLALCSLHHRAFDRNFIGIDPDYRIRVRPDLLLEQDGPTLKGIQQLEQQSLRVKPRQRKDWPDPANLDQRFQRFLAACG